jgi:hypothetical protein
MIKRFKQMSKLKKDTDELWSLAVRTRDGFKCQIDNCESTRVYAHHIISRNHLATRWELDDGISMCWGHHKRFHGDSSEDMRDKVIAVVGQERFDRMKALSKTLVTNLIEEDLIGKMAELKEFIESFRGRRR